MGAAFVAAWLETDGLPDLDLLAGGARLVNFRFPTAPARVAAVDRPGRHGADDRTAWHGPRTIVLEGHATDQAGVDELAAHWQPHRRPVLMFDLGAGLRRVVLRPDDLDLRWQRREWGKIPWLAAGVAPSGILEEPDARTLTVTPTSAAEAGRGYPRTYPLTYPASVPASSAVADNDGNHGAAWTATIVGPCTGPRIEIQADSEVVGRIVFDADLTVPEGATLVVDTDARTALLNGATVSHHVDYALTDWPEIPGGPWQARFYPATDDGATLTIEWRSAWQ